MRLFRSFKGRGSPWIGGIDVQKADPERGAAAIAPAEENYLKSLEQITPDGSSLRVVTFFLNGDEYAFEVVGAVEVVKPREVTEVPQVPEFIKGILSVRGEMVPIMNLKARLGMSSNENDYMMKRILIAGVEERKAGFMVDGMGAVKEFSPAELKRPKQKDGFLMGTVSSKGETIQILDIERLLEI